MRKNQKGEEASLDRELAVVMPVYNESECIGDVIESWLQVLSDLTVDFQLIVLNDGSRDNTAEVLDRWAQHTNITIINKKNSGHGPTILEGYRIAVSHAQWIFQCDSDDEISAREFLAFWKQCEEFDALIGVRTHREQNISRSLISAFSRMTISLLCGKGVVDVNAPFRLIRANLLEQALSQIPMDTFAPNVIISGAIARSNARIANLPVEHTNRRTGSPSIVSWRLWRAAIRAFWQTLHCRPTIRVVN